MEKKNKKIADLKKLAKLGLTAGLLMSSQGLSAGTTQFDGANFDHYLAGGSCGSSGRGSCSSMSGGSYASYQPQGSCANAPQYAGQSGYAQGQYYSTQASCANAQPQAYDSYAAQAQQWNAQATQWQAQSSCAHAQTQQPQHNWQTAQSGCGSKRNNQTAQYATTDDYTHDQNSTDHGTKQMPAQPRPNWSVAEVEHVTTTAPKTAQLAEKDLMDNVNAQSKAIYQSLSPEGKALALKLANQDCKGKNDCKGQNACKTAKNDCAGKGGCKGQSPSNFKDKNQAIKVASMKMAEKRNSVLNK